MMATYSEEQLNSMPIERLEGVATDMAAQVDQNEMALTEAMAPEGEFSMARLNAVVDAMNDVVALMPDVEEYPTFEEDIDIFPPEFVDYFNMINTALRDAALNELEIDFMTAADDRDLAALAGALKSIAKNSEFKRHLKNAVSAAPVEEEVIEEVPLEGEPMMEEVDTLFMDRM